MNKSPFNHFVDILYFMPRKFIFANKEVFIKALESEAQKYKFEKFLPTKNMSRTVSKFFDDLSNNVSVTEDGNLFMVEQLDGFKLLSSASISKEPSLAQKAKKEIAKRLISRCLGYTDMSVKKQTKKSDQILEVAKKYKGIDDQVFTYLCEYSKCWKEEENGE